MRSNIRSIDDITYYKYKGLGHTQQECESDERQGKLMIGVFDEESKENTYEDEEISNFVAFAEISEFVEERKASESDTDDSSSDEESEIDIHESFKEVRDALVETGKENLELKKENARPEEKVFWSTLEHMGREEQGRTWCMDAAQLDTQRKKEEVILKTSSTTYSTIRSSSSTRPAKLQLDRAEKSTVKPEKCCFPLDFPLTLNLISLYLKALSHEKDNNL
ncbi:unnamed protein product [Microthlaspi erraticum]|uniref:Uncharacterized protein n=1 Tax=Microthlaspi erraticum TaxID=1685480 RepID=A0A6D2HZP9_9BRAS|nr:unnamed protein product [Microthlaspi erraticum]